MRHGEAVAALEESQKSLQQESQKSMIDLQESLERVTRQRESLENTIHLLTTQHQVYVLPFNFLLSFVL